jgi:hypothetical protein
MSQQQSTTPAAATAPPSAAGSGHNPAQGPTPLILVQASRLALKMDKPILLDYYLDSLTGKAFLGIDPETKEQMLVKSKEEFTSLVQKVYNINTGEYIIMTENSIYILSAALKKREVSAKSLRQDDA